MNRKFFVVLAAIAMLAFVFAGTQPAWSQATVGSGSIQGTVTDPQGAVVAGAKITITNVATGQSQESATTSSGTYSSGALTPGDYKVRVEAASFRSVERRSLCKLG